MSSPDATREAAGIGLLLDWIDALRRGDLDRIAALLDPGVTWHGLTEDLVCVGREEVLRVVEEQLPMCMRAEALELVVGPDNLVLGTRNPSLPDPAGLTLGGQIYNVFGLVDDRIRSVRDFATRDFAFRTAGLDGTGAWR